MKNWYRNIIAAGIAVAVLGAGMATTPAFADDVKDRKAAMKSLSKANKVLKAYSKGKGNKAAALAAARQIASIGEKLPAMFPKGSDKGYGMTTRAKPAIWEDWAKFKQTNQAMVDAANKVASVGALGTASTSMEVAGGIGKTCGGCHKPFRGPKPKKMKKM
jgi:cytochrome c556